MTRTKVGYLAHHPEHMRTVAAWLYRQWFREAGLTREEAFGRLRERLSCDQTPLTLVAHVGAAPVGVVSLIEEVTPGGWAVAVSLAGLYVVPAWRGRGVGSLLCRRALAEARRLGLPRLCLYTVDQEAYFSRQGWVKRADTLLTSGTTAHIVAFMERRLPQEKGHRL